MAVLILEEIVKATKGRLLSGDYSVFKGVSIDSRTILEGEIFFVLKGERFDGHDFLEEALLKGSGAVISSSYELMQKNKVIIQVDDTLLALQDLAHFQRMKLNVPVIAITGSNGKTTTKEMIYAILSTRFRVLKNVGNLNNHIGLPLSLTRLSPDDEMVVLELGMNASGEIRRLCEIALPSHGVITNIGSAHIGMLGSYKAIRAAKLEILNGLNTVILNGDDGFLMDGIRDFGGKVITFSITNNSNVMAKDVRMTEKGSAFRLEWRDYGSVSVNLNVHGLFNVYNALAASAVCLSLGVKIGEVKDALEAYTAFPMRFEVIRENGMTIINDSYNANPSSIKEALSELVRMSAGKRSVAVLGDMYELGEFSEDAHRGVGRVVSENAIEVFAAVGEMMSLAAEEAEKTRRGSVPFIYKFRDVDETKKKIMNILRHGDTVLIKGSRAMCMERLIKEIKNAV